MPSSSAAAADYAPECTNADYVLDPPLAMLRAMSIQKLQSLRELNIYRRDGKCSVHFLEPVNLVRCNISELVFLRKNGQVEFYPGVAMPPPLGHGVNVRARVVVNGVIGTTADELRLRCQEEGLLFESYDPNTGTWAYIVNSDEVDEEDGDSSSSLPQEIERISTYADSLDGVQSQRPTDTSYPVALTGPRQTRHAMSQQLPPQQQEQQHSTSLARLSTRADRSSTLPTRHGEVSVRAQPTYAMLGESQPILTDFDLPYGLPDMRKETTSRERKAPLVVVRERPHESHAPVYVVKHTESKVYEMNSTLVSRGAAMASLGRSFRCGWHPFGQIIIPTFAKLCDGTESTSGANEVRGAHLTLVNPFYAHATSRHYLQSCAISLLRAVCRYANVKDSDVDESGHFPLLHFNICREHSNSSLSSEKLRELIVAIQSVSSDRTSALVGSTARQAKSLLSLFDALYGLPEADVAENNAISEKRYLNQLRRRNLNAWLKSELSFMGTWTSEDLAPSSAQQLLHTLLCHKLTDAVSIAKKTGSTELPRVLGVCGDGNQFGRFIDTANMEQFDDDPSLRDRVVKLLAGAVEPFVSQPRYERSKNNIAAVPLSATWKQLLGIFAFYGCTPDTSAEEIIDELLKRLDAPASRRETAFPPYAENIKRDVLETNRGRDMLTRGDGFQDSALSVLEGFTLGTSPVSSALHPHASSYCATDYLSPFIILVMVRALRLRRTENYKDAETKVLLGFAAQLACLADGWFWALLPLHMIEDSYGRTVAVREHLCRNAKRYTGEEGDGSRNNADLRNIMKLLQVDEMLLIPLRLPDAPPPDTTVNAPSIRTHISLQDALDSFSRGFISK